MSKAQSTAHVLQTQYLSPLYYPLNGTLGLAAFDDDTWTGSKELHLISDEKIGPNEEELSVKS